MLFSSPYKELINFDILKPNTEFGKKVEKNILSKHSAQAGKLYLRTEINGSQISVVSIKDLQKRMKKRGWGKNPEDFGIAFGDVAMCLSRIIFTAVFYHFCAGKNGEETGFKPIDDSVISPFHDKKFSDGKTLGDGKIFSKDMRILLDAVRKRAGGWDDQYYMILWDNLILFEEMLERSYIKKYGAEINSREKSASCVCYLMSALNEAFYKPDENGHFYEKYDDYLKESLAWKAYDTDTFGPELFLMEKVLYLWQNMITGKIYTTDKEKNYVTVKETGKTLFIIPDPLIFLVDFVKWKVLHGEIANH